MALSFVKWHKKLLILALLVILACYTLMLLPPLQTLAQAQQAGQDTAQASTAETTTQAVRQIIASATVLGDYRDWSAYSAQDDGLICFARSTPTNRSNAARQMPPAYIYITHRPALNRRNIVSIVPGYNFAPEADATLAIGGQSFALLTRKNAAWLKDLNQTSSLITAMRKGIFMTMTATSSNGNKITDTYSLSGVTRAANAIALGCNISQS